MIVGVGTDLVSIPRMRAALARHRDRLCRRLYTAEERAEGEARPVPEVHFASRFAAKEAVLKALGTGWGRKIAWREIEVIGPRGKVPEVRLSGRARLAAEERGVRRLHLSLSHDGDYAVAVVVATD
ncbi:MAG TPA: holo-ACP synthase [Candidatus Methylomirabilis sp.]|nr:holo-ACP synthase [Candidatus Methylomirabilis sp.]